MNGKAALSGIGAALCLGLADVHGACAQDVIDFDIPSEPLDSALTAIGRAAHVNIAFSPAALDHKPSHALKGHYSVSEALRVVLHNSGLEFTRLDSGSFIVTAVKPVEPTAAIAAAAPVPPVQSPAAQRVIPTVVIRGYRASVTQALAFRRSYSGGIESVVAEDIAKIPDNNVAEAIQRVAGVAISRDHGEGRTITVRGMGPEFTPVEINGLVAHTATDGPAQGVNRGRGFDFNVFPSELFSRIDIRKTSEADQPEGSLGATVVLYTPHPFDRRGLRLAASLQGTYNGQSDRMGRRGAFLFSNTFDQNRMGVLVSLAFASTPLDLQGVNSGDWNQGTGNGGFCRPTSNTGGICDVPAADLETSLAAFNLADQPSTYHPQFYRYTELAGRVDRMGGDMSFQWRPHDGTSVSLDAVYSRFATRRTDHFLEAIGFSRGASQGGKPEIVPRSVVLDANRTMTYGLFDNVDVRSEVGIDNFETDFSQVSLLVKHRFGDKLFLEFTAGSSRSTFDNSEDLMVQIDRLNVDGYSFDTRGTGRDGPAINYGFDVSDPANWYFGPRVTVPGGTGASGPEIRLRPNFMYSGIDSLQAKATYEVSSGLHLIAGVQAKRYSNRQVSYRFDQGEADFPAPSVPLSQLTHEFCGLTAVAPPPGTPRCWLEPDVNAFITTYDLLSNNGRTALSTTNTAARGLNQAVIEDDLAIYGKVWFRQSLFGRPIRGDFGLRGIETRQTAAFYTSPAASPDSFVLTSAGRTYADLLPSLNIVFENSKKSLWRFSAAQVMARPPLEYLNAATVVTVNGGQRTVTTGNPNLRPYRATTFDLSYEWYQSTGEVASAGLFYKRISTYIQTLTHIAPYSQTNLPVSLLANTQAAPTDDFSISTAVNTPGGVLKGIELNYQAQFKSLPGAWSKLGVLLNYTYVISRITYQTTTAAGPVTVKADLLNLSRNSYNATIYYDDGTFQARLSTNYRDKYLTAVPGLFNADARGVDAAQFWDCSMSYKVTPNLAITFEGQNLTNEKSENWDNTVTRLVGDARWSGRQFAVGLRYTY